MAPTIPPPSFTVKDRLSSHRLGSEELLLLILGMEALAPAPLAPMRLARVLNLPRIFPVADRLSWQIMRAQEPRLLGPLMGALAPPPPAAMTVALILVGYLELHILVWLTCPHY